MPSSYDGLLKKPLTQVPSPLVEALLSSGDPELSEAFNQWKNLRTQELSERIRELLKHYQIDPNSSDPFYSLSLKLAEAHVPGFKVKRKGGRPKEWTESLLGELYLKVEGLRSEGKSVGSACKILAKEGPWEDLINEVRHPESIPDPAKALQKTYNRASKFMTRSSREPDFSRIKSILSTK